LLECQDCKAAYEVKYEPDGTVKIGLSVSAAVKRVWRLVVLIETGFALDSYKEYYRARKLQKRRPNVRVADTYAARRSPCLR